MSKKQDMEDFDRFMDFIKDNPDVKDMILNALNKAKETNIQYKTGNDPKDGVHSNLPDHLINQKKWSK